jgi:hypothetical protein
MSEPIHDKESRTVSFQVKMVPGEDGHGVGSAHLGPNQLMEIAGVPNPDLLNINNIEVTKVSSSVGDTIGGTFHTRSSGGDDFAQVALDTKDRSYVLNHGKVATGFHFTVPPAKKPGETTTTTGSTTVKLATDPDRIANTKTGLSRAMRWGNDVNKTAAELSATCTRVQMDGDTRVMVPKNPGLGGCAMSRLVAANMGNPGFCDGAYKTTGQTVTDASGTECRVMHGHHFDQVAETLKANLTNKSAFEHGLELNLETANPMDAGTANGSNMVTVEATIHRDTVRNVLSPEAEPSDAPMSVAEAHGLLGYSPEVAFSGQTDEQQLAKQVFGMKLSTGSSASPSADSKFAITEGGASDQPAEEL